MLVLSRKESDRIVFPTLGITVELLRIRGNTARIGIDAPADVPVLRHELADLKALMFGADDTPQQQLSRLIHALQERSRLSADALNDLHRHLEGAGDREGRETRAASLRTPPEIGVRHDRCGGRRGSTAPGRARAACGR